MNGKWLPGPEKTVYESDWMTVSTAKTTLPDQTEIDHHIVRAGIGGANVVCYDPAQGVLLIWRHRLIPDKWGWELPGGRIDEGEKPQEAAKRELVEETGWQVEALEELTSTFPMGSFVDHQIHSFFATDPKWVGPGPDMNEVGELSWAPITTLREIVSKGEIHEGISLIPLLYALTFGPLKDVE